MEISIHHIQLCYHTRMATELPSKRALFQDYNNPNDVMHFYFVILYCKMHTDHKSLFSREVAWLHAYRFLVTSPLPASTSWTVIFYFSLYIYPSNPYQPKRWWLESTEILCDPWITHHTFLEFCPPGWLLHGQTANSILQSNRADHALKNSKSTV